MPESVNPHVEMNDPNAISELRRVLEKVLDFYGSDTQQFVAKYGHGVTTRMLCDDIRRVLADTQFPGFLGSAPPAVNGEIPMCYPYGTVSIWPAQGQPDRDVKCICGVVFKHSETLNHSMICPNRSD